MLIQLIKSKDEKPADSIDLSLDFIGDNWVQNTFYVLKGSLSQCCSLAQTLIITE